MNSAARFKPINLLRWSVPLWVFLALLLVLSLRNDNPPAPEAVAPTGIVVSEADDGAVSGTDTESQIERLQAALADDPENPEALAGLGNAYYLRVRETGDVAFYTRAEEAYERALASNPDNVTAIAGQATLALARHDFAKAFELARRARTLEPGVVASYPALIDAQIELGRYGPATDSLNRLLELKPGLAGYARASYLSELNGDLAGAEEAIQLAISAGSGSAEGDAYVQGLLGKLEFDRGNYAEAQLAYRTALAVDPDNPAATAGLARVQAAQGRLGPAIAGLREVVDRLPLPEYSIALGEIEQAAGRSAAADRSYALVGVQAKLLADQGVNSDVELAIFTADHGDPGEAVELGRAVWEAAPSVRSADAYSWALNAAGRTDAAIRISAEAMKLGSRDPSFLYHAGIIARDAGQADRARRLLGRLLEQSPGFNPLFAPRAKKALNAL